MEQFNQFNADKQATIDTLNNLREILGQLDDMGVNVQDDFKKIAASLQSVESDVLRIALLGAFSDGKTSVVAAWLGKVMDDMKIDMDESSDRLAIYKPEGLPGQCEIIDTPGLFGDKEQAVDGEQMMYEDLTKRYISEAHVIFYVVDAINPLKESHSTIAKWILRDLNKLSSTIFVINKMDEVTDLTEQVLFDKQATIKKENLKSKLQRAAGLTPDELARLNIVCIASNPNGRGLGFWFDKQPEQYESRSRINALKIVANRVLQSNVPEVLIAKTGLDVVRDVVGKKLVLACDQLTELESYEEQKREESTRIKEDISQGRIEVKRLAGELFNELQAMENQILGRLRPLSLEDIHAFLDDEIGYKENEIGYKLHLKIKTAIDRLFNLSSAVTERISTDIDRQLKSSESFLDAMGDQALKSVAGVLKGISALNPSVIKETIFVARDILGQIGIAFKFKPWQATKLAGSISQFAGPVGAVISLGADVHKAYKSHELEQKSNQVKAEISGMIKGAFKDIYDILREDEKMFDFFAPQLKEFEIIVVDMCESAELIRGKKEKVMKIQAQLNDIVLPHPSLALT